jgi:hypothetical protein
MGSLGDAMRIRDAARLESRAMQGIACGVAVAVLLLLDRSPEAAQKREVIVVDRPTVVAFFPLMTDAEMDKDPDANEALVIRRTSPEASGGCGRSISGNLCNLIHSSDPREVEDLSA